MTVLAEAPGIRCLTDDDLAAMFAGAPDETRDAIVGELGRRDRLEQDRRKRDAQREEWESGAYAQMLEAERECCGNLVNRRGVAMGITDWSLWSGPESRALAYATEELRNFWDAHPRVTVTDHREQIAAGRRIQLDEIDRAKYAAEREDKMIGELARGAVRTAEFAARQQQARQRVDARTAEIRQARGVVATREAAAVAWSRPDPEPLDGCELLDNVARYLSTYCALPSLSALVAVTGWATHAVARERDDTGIGQLIWRASPRLLVTAAERDSGKSTLLDLIVNLTRAEGKIPKISPAAYAKRVGKWYQTAVVDEAKTVFGNGQRNMELQGLLLAGYTPKTNYEVANKQLSVFGALAYAGKDELITEATGEQIGDLVSRSITIRMVRPPAPLAELDEDGDADGDVLAASLIDWTDQERARLRQAAREIAREDQGNPSPTLRFPQIWRPLRAIARVAGGHWPDHMDEAMAELSRQPTALAEDGQHVARAEASDRMANIRERSANWAPSPFGAIPATAPEPDEDAGWAEDED